MQNEYGEVILYQTEDGKTSLEIQLQDDTIWLTQVQIADLFDKDVRTINEHLKKIYKDGELKEDSTIRKFRIVRQEGKRTVKREITHYNLDGIISVGYRVNSIRGTQFRIWATSVLREHLIRGYTVNEKRLAEKDLMEMDQAVTLLSRTLQNHQLIEEEGQAVLDVVSNYAKSWTLLLQYDEQQLSVPRQATK